MPISIGRDHFASTQRFYERIGSRFQKQTRVQIPENRSELRENRNKRHTKNHIHKNANETK
jgi:hypothetical protein